MIYFSHSFFIIFALNITVLCIISGAVNITSGINSPLVSKIKFNQNDLIEIGSLGPIKIYAPWQYRDQKMEMIYTDQMVINDERTRQKFVISAPKVSFMSFKPPF